jgi:hypothetical protein
VVAALCPANAVWEARAVAARLGRRGPSDAADDLAQDLAIRVLARTRVHRALAGLRARVQGLRSLLIGWHGTRATVPGLTIASAAGVTPQLEVLRPKNEGTVLALPIHPALHVLARHSSLDAAPRGSKDTLPAVTPHRPAKRDSGAESQIAAGG